MGKFVLAAYFDFRKETGAMEVYMGTLPEDGQK